jgi:hypothetical protein
MTSKKLSNNETDEEMATSSSSLSDSYQTQNYHQDHQTVTYVDGVQSNQQIQVGHSFCGCLCDMRRAVVIVSFINLFLIVVYTINEITNKLILHDPSTTSSHDNSTTSSHDNTTASSSSSSSTNTTTTSTTTAAFYQYTIMGTILMCLQCVAPFCSMYGAINFNIYYFTIPVFVYTVQFVIVLSAVIKHSPNNDIVQMIVAIVSNVLYLYPHFVYIIENVNGTMTKSNYPNVKQSICCV